MSQPVVDESVVPHMTPDEFRRHGHEVIEWIARYMERVEELPVLSRVQPGAVRAQLPAHPPEEGQAFDAVLADFERVVLPGITHWQSPSFFAYFPSNNSGPSILGDLLSSGLGGVYPKGIPVGTVTGVVREQAGWERVYRLLPAANPGAVAHVMVLVAPPAASMERAFPSDSALEAMRLDSIAKVRQADSIATARAEAAKAAAAARAEAAAKAAAARATPRPAPPPPVAAPPTPAAGDSAR